MAFLGRRDRRMLPVHRVESGENDPLTSGGSEPILTLPANAPDIYTYVGSFPPRYSLPVKVVPGQPVPLALQEPQYEVSFNLYLSRGSVY